MERIYLVVCYHVAVTHVIPANGDIGCSVFRVARCDIDLYHVCAYVGKRVCDFCGYAVADSNDGDNRADSYYYAEHCEK